MASISKRNKSREVKVRKKGKPTITKSFPGKREAEVCANTIESEIDRGIYIDRSIAEQTIFDKVIDRFNEEIIPTLRGAKSERSRIRHLRKNIMVNTPLHNLALNC